MLRVRVQIDYPSVDDAWKSNVGGPTSVELDGFGDLMVSGQKGGDPQLREIGAIRDKDAEPLVPLVRKGQIEITGGIVSKVLTGGEVGDNYTEEYTFEILLDVRVQEGHLDAVRTTLEDMLA